MARSDGGIYISKAENILRSVTGKAHLMIFSRLLVKVCPPQELTLVIGSSAHLPCVAGSDLKPTIGWTKEGNSLHHVASSVLLNGTLLFENIKKSHKGTLERHL